MSQLALRRSESPPESQCLSAESQPSTSTGTTQDSPTTTSYQTIDYHPPFAAAAASAGRGDTTPVSPLTITLTSAGRFLRKPAPSPLHTTTAVSPPSSASPRCSTFPSPSPAQDSFSSSPVPSVHSLVRDSLRRSPSPEEDHSFAGPSYRKGQFSPPVTPVYLNNNSPCLTPTSPAPNDLRTATLDRVSAVAAKPISPVASVQSPTMAGSATASPVDGVNGAPRTSSIDSVMSTISSRTQSQQRPQDTSADIETLVRAAGSPEGVIQYLLKEKHSQSQQNAQLWRLVDKQRAMILGLNKDLERALKDKEKYRKKLKDVMAVHDENLKRETLHPGSVVLPSAEIVEIPTERPAEVPASPSNLDSGSAKHSPINVTLAPYPITPPADQTTAEPLSAVGQLLDPSHAMPKASEHALDNYDHEEEERVAADAKKAAEATKDLPIHMNLPPSRSLPSEPPRMPPPAPPTGQPPSVSVIEATPLVDPVSQFPPPSAPPPRKPPPAPLQLKKDSAPPISLPEEEDNDSSSDYDSLLGVDELPPQEKRGRRRTREEDDRDREILAQQEAEARSLSKKSKKSSQKGTPLSASPEQLPPSPRTTSSQGLLAPEHASLAGVLNSNGSPQKSFTVPMMSPGLPASPRPANFQSPPLSPRGAVTNSLPLSPRAPRQPIPLPPNTARTHSPQMEPLSLTSPKPLNISKRASDSEKDSKASRESPVERNKIYQGFATEEYPELLLPPNALPSIIVKVASSRMKPSRASVMSLTQLEEDPVFTLAIYSRAQGGELWRVEKDTTSFGKLDQRMKLCSNFTAKTPDRSLFSGHAPAKLDTRRVVLDQYLDELLDTQLDQQSALELCKYLSTNTLPPMSDEAPSPNESNNDAGVQKKGPGGRPFKNGYLTKRGKNFGGWKARFFVLDGPHLKYYEAPGGAHLGTIKLQNAQIGKQSQNSNDGSPAQAPNGEELDNQYRHAFLVLEPKKKDSSSHVKHVLCAESDKERDQWVEALLRWIDYREPTDEESQSRERHGSGSQNHVNGANAKKKMYAQNKPHVSRANSQEALIGMSYDSARQGDIPDGAPPKRRGTNSPEFQEKPAGSAYTISAPKDPQIINESNPWSGKNVPTTPGPSYEEKKARKRSFFGFGPKTRASADDQDTLFGSSTTSNASQGQSVYRGQAQQVFGAPLAEAVRFHGPADVKVPLPSVVYRCIQYLDAKKAIFEEGIFRLSGSNVVIKQLRERFNNESDVNLLTDETYYDIHAVASLLKLYLRELPTTILTRDLHPHFMSITEMTNHREKIMALSELAQRLPLASDTLLKYLIAFLIKIINNSDRNKMTVRNVGIVFSPTLNIPAPVFALLLQNYEGVFGIAPEQYQLPSPGGPDPREKQPRAVVEKQPRAVVEQPPRAVVEQPPRAVVEQQPRRPSTAGAASSPSRQRLMEQMQQRSSPTPPPVMSSNGARPGATSATPPPRQVYEPSYYAQQGTSTQTSTRPAYESGFVVPSGYEQNIARATRQPAYDQPHYGNSYEGQYGSNGSPATYDPSYGNNQPKRRDSHMFFMGGNMLNHQGSNSRLREETRM